jgi:dolichol-phosphate mannosyltransferase
MRILVLLPTYNERQNIEAMLNRVLEINRARRLGLEVLVIDDNSPDGTGGWVAEFAKRHPEIRLLARSGKLGLGTAYRAGFGFAIDNGYDAVVQMDCDFSQTSWFTLRSISRATTWWSAPAISPAARWPIGIGRAAP